ncbi:MAG: MFS transporter [Halieaceae bacterium]|jgi:MFS family permease|uniref:MFS transporter n=1 Tax=Haliea alexandrii TaxID=2448162 RepID=UPI000F0B24FC|nr:MFS transporter [Haliea alexandrii]MCR9186819.1 MFS transporter [Halieaceae bacterium]
MDNRKQARIFYGWWLVLICLLIQSMAAGVTIYFYSILAGEIEQEFSSGRALVMLGLTGSAITTSLIAPKMGDWLDRHSIRFNVSASAAVMGAGFVVMSFTPNVWGFIASYAVLIAAGTISLSMLFAPLLLSRWFVRHRGLAIGIAALGTQVGGFLIPPLITLVIDAYDWRVAVRVIGLVIAIVIPLLSWRTIIDHPAIANLGPDGDAPLAPESTSGDAPAAPPTRLAVILADRSFWLAGFGIAVMVAMFTTVLANLAFFASDIGSSRDQAAWLISLYALVGMVCSPLIGRFCDMLDIRSVFAGLLAVNIGALVLFREAESYQGLLYATALVGVSGGGLMPFWGALIGRLFSLRQYGTVMGAMTLFAVGASSLAPILSGLLFDTTGNYQLVLTAFILLTAIALLCIPLMRRDEQKAAPLPVSS